MELIVSINLALGILYANLKASRYRDKLFDAMLTVLKTRAPKEAPDGNLYSTLCKNDGVFSDNHHLVSAWVKELPDSSVAPRHQQLFSGSDELPKLYHWFKNDSDRRACIYGCSVVAVLLAWVLFFVDGYGLNLPVWVGLIVMVLLAAGQICVAWHFIQGRKLVKEHGKRFADAVAYISTTLEVEATKSFVLAPSPADRTLEVLEALREVPPTRRKRPAPRI